MSQPSAEPEASQPKLNILMLPGHTSILFALIALVVLGAVFSSVLPGSQLFWPPLVLGMTLLPVRDFLHWPDQLIRSLTRKSEHSTPQDSNGLQNELQAVLATIVPTPEPMVLISDSAPGAQAFGTFRRRYIVIGRRLATAIATAIQDKPAEKSTPYKAILAHELAHFLNKDVWQMALSRSLLKMMFLVMFTNLWVGFSMALFIIEVGPEVMRPEFWSELAAYLESLLPALASLNLGRIYDMFLQRNPETVARLADPTQSVASWWSFFYYLTSTHLPFFLSGLILWIFYWPHLMRVREFYADAQAATWTGKALAVREAMTVYHTITRIGDREQSWRQRLGAWFSDLSYRVRVLRLMLAVQPSGPERRACLQEPQRALGTWRNISVSVGVAVVLLDLTLRGTLTAAYISEPGAHLPLLVAFAVLGVWLLPKVCMGCSLQHIVGRAIVPAVLLFTTITLLPHFLDGAMALVMMGTDPVGGGKIIDLWAYSAVGAWGGDLPRLMGAEISWVDFLGWHVIRPIGYLAFLMPPVLIGFLAADAALKRRALTWYGKAERVRGVFWGISGVLACVLGLAVIPVLNHLVFPDIYQNWTIAALVGFMLACLLLLVAGVFFWWWDGRLARKCPHCELPVPDSFQLGATCSCGQPLHPWLIARY